MSINALFPFAGNNAIQSVGFAIDFNVPLTPEQIKVVLDDAELKRILPKRRQPSFSISFDITTGRAVQNESLTEGQLFSESKSIPGGMVQVLNITPMGLVAQFNAYKSWSDTVSHIGPTVERVLHLIPGASAAAVGLQYNDIFDWRGAEPIDYKEIFKEGNEFLPSNIFERKGLWHAHNGYASTIEHPVESQTIENVNVNVVAEAGALRIVIVTSHRGTFAPRIGEGVGDAFKKLTNAFHARNKDILRQLLTAEVASKIGLGEKS